MDASFQVILFSLTADSARQAMRHRENYPQIKYTIKAQNAPHEIPTNAKVLRARHFSEEWSATVPELRLISRSMKISGIDPRFDLQRLRAFGFTGAPRLWGIVVGDPLPIR